MIDRTRCSHLARNRLLKLDECVLLERSPPLLFEGSALCGRLLALVF
jgi:hypothetical protein